MPLKREARNLNALSVIWTIRLYRRGGTSGLRANVHEATGDAATGAGFVSVLMVSALFRRDAKVALGRKGLNLDPSAMDASASGASLGMGPLFAKDVHFLIAVAKSPFVDW